MLFSLSPILDMWWKFVLHFDGDWFTVCGSQVLWSNAFQMQCKVNFHHNWRIGHGENYNLANVNRAGYMYWWRLLDPSLMGCLWWCKCKIKKELENNATQQKQSQYTWYNWQWWMNVFLSNGVMNNEEHAHESCRPFLRPFSYFTTESGSSNSFIHFIWKVWLNGIVVHIQKFCIIYKNVIWFRLFCETAERFITSHQYENAF